MWKVGIHNCYWIGFGCESMDQVLEASAGSGVDYLEVLAAAMEGLDPGQRERIRQKALGLGLGLSANGGFGPETDIASDDPAVRRRGIELAKRIIEGLSRMDITSWSGVVYGAWKMLPAPGSIFTADHKKQAWEHSVNSLKEILRTAGDYQVTLSLEVVNRYEHYLLNTAEEGVRMAEETESGFCKVLLDSFHMNIEEDDMGEAIRHAYMHDKIGEIHIGEANRRVPGTGKSHMDWEGFFGTLRDIGYEGMITMEPFLVQGLPISSKICVWRDLSRQADPEGFADMIRTGAGFIRGFWAADGK